VLRRTPTLSNTSETGCMQWDPVGESYRPEYM
jgi:hypothetical protein